MSKLAGNYTQSTQAGKADFVSLPMIQPLPTRARGEHRRRRRKQYGSLISTMKTNDGLWQMGAEPLIGKLTNVIRRLIDEGDEQHSSTNGGAKLALKHCRQAQRYSYPDGRACKRFCDQLEDLHALDDGKMGSKLDEIQKRLEGMEKREEGFHSLIDACKGLVKDD